MALAPVLGAERAETVCAVCRYAETVIYRIFYALDRCGTGMLSLRELKRCVPPPSPGTRHCSRSVAFLALETMQAVAEL